MMLNRKDLNQWQKKDVGDNSRNWWKGNLIIDIQRTNHDNYDFKTNDQDLSNNRKDFKGRICVWTVNKLLNALGPYTADAQKALCHS